MKVAAAAVVWNLDATVIFPEDHFHPRLFTPSLAQKYELYKVNGVKFLADVSINSLVPGIDGIVAAVWLKERAATLEHGDVIKSKVLY